MHFHCLNLLIDLILVKQEWRGFMKVLSCSCWPDVFLTPAGSSSHYGSLSSQVLQAVVFLIINILLDHLLSQCNKDDGGAIKPGFIGDPEYRESKYTVWISFGLLLEYVQFRCDKSYINLKTMPRGHTILFSFWTYSGCIFYPWSLQKRNRWATWSEIVICIRIFIFIWL